MRKFKFILATMLLMGSVTFFAFKPAPKKFTPQYWEYSGNGSAVDQEEYAPAMAPSCATGTAVVCTILAEEDPNNLGFPLIDNTPLETRIVNKDESNSDVFVRN